MAAEDRPRRGRGSSVGYAIVLLGAALFVVTSFLPYYGFATPPIPGRSISLYQASTSGEGGGSDLGAVLFLFGGVAPRPSPSSDLQGAGDGRVWRSCW